jgi:hypothetical protein
MTEPMKAPAGEAMPNVDEILAEFRGDARAAIASLVADVAHLERELSFASLAMGFGFTRGWRPSRSRRQ